MTPNKSNISNKQKKQKDGEGQDERENQPSRKKNKGKKEDEDKEEEDKEEEDKEIEEKKRNRFSNSHFEIILDFLERPGKYDEISNIGKRGNGGKSREKAFAELTEYFKERIRHKPALAKGLRWESLTPTDIMNRWDYINKKFKKPATGDGYYSACPATQKLRERLETDNDHASDPQANAFVDANDVSLEEEDDEEEEVLLRHTAAAYSLAVEDPDEGYILLSDSPEDEAKRGKMKALSSGSREDGSHDSSHEGGSSSQEGKKKGKDKAARHWSEIQSAGEEDELSHVDDALEHEDQDDAPIPDIGPSTQRSKGKKVQRMKIRRRNDCQVESASQYSKRSSRSSSTVERNFALYTEQKLRLQETESSERLKIRRMEANDRQRLTDVIERSTVATEMMVKQVMETQAMLLAIFNERKAKED
ncbi:hypothetical protein BGX20_004362 [Mortierella sp. AD010]|nr:hypothetical protein BGX20_004362 [Mortierella sp. AD010]